MGKFDKYLIVTDYDGSLADRGEISPENAEAILHFQQNGGLFTIASGRPAEFLYEKRGSVVPNAPLVALNGTLICDPETLEPIAEFPLDEGALDAICLIAETTSVEQITIYPKGRESAIWHRDSGVDVRAFFENIPRPWYKGIFIQHAQHTPEVISAAKRLFPTQYHFDCSWAEGVEINAPDAGKGECLHVLRSWAKREDLTIIGVGDYENDLSLIRMADIGVAVENAVPALKAAADRVTVRCTDHAIAKIISELE